MENNLTISLETDSYNVLSSGVVMIPKEQKLIINIANLKFIVRLENNKENRKSYFGFNPVDETTLELVLYNLTNALFASPQNVIPLTEELSLLFSIQSSTSGNNIVFFYTFFKTKENE